jgi:alpha-L-fucosidase
MKKNLLAMVFCSALFLPLVAQIYQPSASNLIKRTEFQNNKFGMFIHWGASSVLADGEWVMNNKAIKIKDYYKLQQIFNPTQFDAAQWVSVAKNAGMKYIVFITRHHDGFSNWGTQYSAWNITNTPYKKDVLKMLAEECKKQGMQLGLYYSLLDWVSNDYPYETGRTGQTAGRNSKSNYDKYFQFMKNQLTELLTNYGDIMSIWFDGHWDQTNPEGSADRTSRINWKYEELYAHIHQLQPQCLIGNNHHLSPFEGEDFQMFEKDLPGQNKTGLSFQQASLNLPVETCETINGSWGYNITDNNYKTVKDLIHYLVNAAGLNTNFLLNVGPMPNGLIQTEFVDTLQAIGNWLKKNGATIFNTRGGIVASQDWGVITQKEKSLYVHILKPVANKYIFIPNLKTKIVSAHWFNEKLQAPYKQVAEGTFIYINQKPFDGIDTIIELKTE